MVRLLAALAVLACLVGLALDPPKHRASEPSRLEKSCPAKVVYVPCFILDEWRQTEFNI